MFSCYLLTLSFILTTSAQQQEHLTCLRTDTILSPLNIQPPNNIQRGYRGKQGPKGQKGDSGSAAAESSFNLFRGNLKNLYLLVVAITAHSRQYSSPGWETAKRSYGLRVNLPPAYMPTTHSEDFHTVPF